MESVKILIDGIEKEVFGVFYVYNAKYYFIYTEKEIDENGYVILYMTQVGKETQSTPNGNVETGFLVGMEITNPEEQKNVQASISYIVEDKKNGTKNPQIQYMPMNMLAKFKIISKKRFRLLKSIMEDNFKLVFENISVENAATNSSNVETTPLVDSSVETSVSSTENKLNYDASSMSEQLVSIDDIMPSSASQSSENINEKPTEDGTASSVEQEIETPAQNVSSEELSQNETPVVQDVSEQPVSTNQNAPVSLDDVFNKQSNVETNSTLKECDEGDLQWISRDFLNNLPKWEGDQIFLDLLWQDAPFFLLTLRYSGDKLVEAVLNGEKIR